MFALSYIEAIAEDYNLHEERTLLEERLIDMQAKRKSFTTSGWISLGAGALSAVGSVVSYFLGRQAMEAYGDAVGTDTTAAARSKVELWERFSPYAQPPVPPEFPWVLYFFS